MTRAAIFIGVNKAGNLPPLQDAVKGAKDLHDNWAITQKIGPSILLTDENQPVTPDSIRSAIEKILSEEDSLSQLCIYFAGHGVNVRMGEYWLLTDSHKNAQAAVNVRGSEDLARYCGVPHIVFISDACRTAADTINLQNVTGSEIFPIDLVSDKELPVDQFYACALGRPAHEARDITITSSQFKAIYTSAINDALCFKVPNIIEWGTGQSNDIGYIRPRKLRDALPQLVADRIRALNLQSSVIQVPAARITSDPDAWLSIQDKQNYVASRDQVAPPDLLLKRSNDKHQRGTKLFRFPDQQSLSSDLLDAKAIDRSLVNLALLDIKLVSDAIGPFQAAGPQHFETQCGFKIRGASFVEGFSIGVDIQSLGPTGEIIRAQNISDPLASILFILDDGSGIVLPPIPEFIASLTVDDGELIDVSYEPSDNTQRWGEYVGHANELRTLRKVISLATRSGAFALEGDEALSLARRMRYSKSLDPSLAVYAAYGFNDLHHLDLIQEMYRFMKIDVGAPLFDVAMLARELDGKKLAQRSPVRGFAPLLSQGWAYLQSRRIPLPAGVGELSTMLRDSVWTMYTANGVDRLRHTVFKGAKPWKLV